MRNAKKQWICCATTALALTASLAGAVSAAEVSDKCGGMNLAVANVENELLVRKTASASGEVVGFLPGAAGMIVQSMNEEWTKITSGNISGYVKTDYLAFGEEAEALKEVYGVPGAVAAWDDVKVFADYEDTSSVIATISAGEGFEVLGSSDNWLEIQLADGNLAYVPVEDVEMTTVLDTAIGTEDTAGSVASLEAADAGAEDSVYTEPADLPEETWEEPVYTQEEAYAEPVYTEEAYSEPVYTEEEVYSEQVYTGEEVYAGADAYASAEDWTQTEAYVETPTYAQPETYTEPEAYAQPETYAQTEAPQPATYAAAETAQQESTAQANYSSSDLDLLAALIYCEAGNQSQEGKVAVGQVVMNRVESDSFADSIHDVIYESGQFTPAYSGWLDQVIGSAPQDCYDAAQAALNGEGTVGDSLYFNAGSGKGMQLGDHQFY